MPAAEAADEVDPRETHGNCIKESKELACSPQLPGRGVPTRVRTQDVQSDAASFRELMVSETLVASLAAAGFDRPSPVQKAAIPLGRVGTDLIVQAKSGTGKTVVFAVICLERVKVEKNCTQALILAPTREIAIQSEQVIRALASELPGPAITSGVFVGGLPMVEDEKKLRRLCHVAVGTPGRVGALLQAGRLVPDSLAVLVLDEADSLLGDSFYEDVTWIYDQLPKRKQVLAFSATYTPELLADLEPLMRKPQRVMMCAESVSLLGVKQFYASVQPAAGAAGPHGTEVAAAGAAEPDGEVAAAAATGGSSATPAVFRQKVQQLLRLLSVVSFHQAAVFCNHKPRAEWLAEQLSAAGYPSAYLSGDRAQVERMEAMAAIRVFKLRVVVSTDVMARGVDLERVNLVVNLDLPHDAATYMHRVGRTGRFGSRGVCVSYVTPAELALLLSYVDEQQAQAAAAASAAVAAATANGGGGGVEGEAEGGGSASVRKGQDTPAMAPAEELLLPLPDVIPEDLYDYELASDWERQALQQLVQNERQARQQLLAQKEAVGDEQAAGLGPGQGAAAVQGTAGGPLEPTPGSATGAAGSGGDARGIAGGPAAELVRELPPLPEEIKAAKRSEQAALAAASKAEKEHLRREKLQRRQQEAACGGPEEQQEQHASWAAYGQYAHAYNAYGYGGYQAPQAAAGTDTTASTNTSRLPSSSYPIDPRCAYPRYPYSYPYQDYYSSYLSYYSPQTPYHDQQTSSYNYSQEEIAAAWKRYYAQWQQPYPGSAWQTSDTEPAAAGLSDSVPSSRHPSGAQGDTRATATGLEAARGDSRPGLAGQGEEKGPREGEEADGSELSFSALRGQPVPGAGGKVLRPPAAPLVAGTQRAAGLDAGDDASDADASSSGEAASEADDDEDASWVVGDDDFTGEAAQVIDRLEVLLPGTSPAGPFATAAKASAEAAGLPPVKAGRSAGSAQQGQNQQPAAAGNQASLDPYAASGPGTNPSSSYGYAHYPYMQGAYGAWQQQGTAPQPPGGDSYEHDHWSYGPGAWQGTAGYCHGQGRPGPHPYALPGPPVHPHHPYRHPPPTPPPPPYSHHHHHHPWPQYGLPYHPHHHGHHHHPPPYYSDHPHGYGYGSYSTQVQYPYQGGWYRGSAEDSGSASLKRALQEYVQQHRQWQQAYATWYDHYQKWYDSWLQAEGEAGQQGDS